MRCCPQCGYQLAGVPGHVRGWDIEDAIQMFREGDTLEVIGNKYGVSREAIRQGLTKSLGAEYKEVACLSRESRESRKAHPRQQVIRCCFVCGDQLPGIFYVGAKYSFCNQHGSDRFVRGSVMRMVDTNRQAMHAALVRKNRNLPEPTYDGPIWSQRKKKRWLNTGSQLHALVTESYQKGWPLFDLLPDEIRDQIKAEAG